MASRQGWLTPGRRPREATGRPWHPPALPPNADVAKLAYVVVEERVDSVIGLLIAPWPRVGRDGHLRFPRSPGQLEVAADLDALQEFLDEYRRTRIRAEPQSQALRTRSVALGDVFAARVKLRALADPEPSDGPRAVGDWLGRPVYDVTADAREAARAVFFDAVSAPLPKKVERQLIRKLREGK